jgi:hypothetical protein
VKEIPGLARSGKRLQASSLPRMRRTKVRQNQRPFCGSPPFWKGLSISLTPHRPIQLSSTRRIYVVPQVEQRFNRIAFLSVISCSSLLISFSSPSISLGWDLSSFVPAMSTFGLRLLSVGIRKFQFCMVIGHSKYHVTCRPRDVDCGCYICMRRISVPYSQSNGDLLCIMLWTII